MGARRALILGTASPGSARAVGADPATLMGYDLANGLFLSPLKTYAKAATVGGASVWWCLVAGLFCTVANLTLLLGLAALIYAITHLIPLPPVFRRWAGVYTILILAAAGLALRYRPAQLWAAILGTALTLIGVPAFAFKIWSSPSLITLMLFFLIGYYLCEVVVAVVTLVGAAIHFATLLGYLLLTRRQRVRGYQLNSFFWAAWLHYNFIFTNKRINVLKFFFSSSLLGMIMYMICLQIEFANFTWRVGGYWLGSHLPIPFWPWVNFFITIFASLIGDCGLVVIALRSWFPALKQFALMKYRLHLYFLLRYYQLLCMQG